MGDDAEDILNSVKAHGIRSPFNFHAIKSTFILWPTACGSCEKTIYPFSSVVICIKCKVIFHRGPCMRDTKRICEHVMKKANTAASDDLVVVEENVSVDSLTKRAETEHLSSEPVAVVNIDSIQSQHATVDTTTTKNPSVKHNDEILSRNDGKPELPTDTVIISSVWRSKARSLASSQLQRLERIPFPLPSSSNPIDDNTLKTLQLFVHHTLADSSSFPCKVCSALHATYVNSKFATHKDVLVNGIPSVPPSPIPHSTFFPATSSLSRTLNDLHDTHATFLRTLNLTLNDTPATT